MATHSSTLAWKIPWIEEPGGLQSMGSQRVRHSLVTKQQQQKSQPQSKKIFITLLNENLKLTSYPFHYVT